MLKIYLAVVQTLRYLQLFLVQKHTMQQETNTNLYKLIVRETATNDHKIGQLLN